MVVRHHTDIGHWRALCYLVGQVSVKENAYMYVDMLNKLRLYLESSPTMFQPCRLPPSTDTGVRACC